MKQYNMEKLTILIRTEIFYRRYKRSERLKLAFKGGFVLHAAALKHVPIAEYNH